MRTGVIAKKEGMTRIFDEEGKHVPVTVLRIDNCQVVAVRSEEKQSALQKHSVVTSQKQKSSQRKSWLNSASTQTKLLKSVQSWVRTTLLSVSLLTYKRHQKVKVLPVR